MEKCLCLTSAWNVLPACGVDGLCLLDDFAALDGLFPSQSVGHIGVSFLKDGIAL